ncbi:lytic transglycosylase domain-containing protein [Sphingomonas pruni]|uniref:lytic transglycosylase domain-containing protein n=1 Tax=Sphingomonas pruni TaxID=40683 RepID=UPI0008374577|nr:lytic transglycosylase domain-containing protein [Sphingomonas pruni]
MAALRLLAIAVAFAPVPAAARRVADWQPYMAEASQRFAVPVSWIAAVMRIESGGQTTLGGRPIVSRAGAMGPMQVMPATWASLRAALALGQDPFDPHDNILAGAAYLRMMYDRFGYPGCFAAYNAGPARYAAYLAGRPLPAETVDYVAAVGSLRTGDAGVTGRVGSGGVVRAITPAAATVFAIPPRW